MRLWAGGAFACAFPEFVSVSQSSLLGHDAAKKLGVSPPWHYWLKTIQGKPLTLGWCGLSCKPRCCVCIG
jgi:hypothetical protein